MRIILTVTSVVEEASTVQRLEVTEADNMSNTTIIDIEITIHQNSKRSQNKKEQII